jgi:hypothetical protein
LIWLQLATTAVSPEGIVAAVLSRVVALATFEYAEKV